jgi:hypothetical protein
MSSYLQLTTQVLPAIAVPGSLYPQDKPNLAQSENNPDYLCDVYMEALRRWELPLWLHKGTLGMQDAGRKYLPQDPAEEDVDYKRRLCRSVLYGVYSRVVKVLRSLPFIDPVVTKNIPPELEDLRKSCTDAGLTIEELGQQLMQDMIDRGLCHFMVDYPEAPAGLNAQQERDLGLMPYFARIDPLNVISWDIEKGQLLQLCVYDCVYVDKGKFGKELKHRITVYSPDLTEVYEFQGQGWSVIDTKPNYMGYITLVTAYGNQEGEMSGSPVLEEMAWLNLCHWQKLSDLNNIEHVVNVPFLLGTGFAENELEEVAVGVNAMVTTTAENAKLTYVEHSGNGIQWSQISIDKLEKRMIAMGADPLTQQATSRQTAFAKGVDTGQSMSIMTAMVNNLSQAFTKGYEIAAEWMEIEAKDVDVVVGEGIDLSLDAADAAELRTLAEKGFLSVEFNQIEEAESRNYDSSYRWIATKRSNSP